MNRIDRLTAILIQLQGKRVVKAAEIAERFNISLRTVYRDVKALQESGVPIGAEAGTGYYIVDGYHLPPVMFNKEEAAALLTGEKLMEKFGDRSSERLFSSAMQKIRAVLRSSDKDYLESLDANIEVFSYGRSNEPEQGFPNRFLSDVQQAIAMQRVIAMDYYAYHNSTTNRREAEPIGVFHAANSWHLIAYCRLRKDYRDFRIDRIKSLNLLELKYNRAAHLTLREYLDQNHNHERPFETRVRFTKNVARFIQERKYYAGFVEEKDAGDHVEMTFVTSSLEYFGQWLLSFTNEVEILSPEPLHEVMRSLVRAVQAHYSK
ncbi:YafY family transcriptional regulator [Chitinophaga horti]|uniref:YafY family transcriptional regulator n=1 Tax=Chitinophaga horti TaxID=2920382 RepID=A0ABY6J0G9_9BACT|nr:YafY family protein [Chitinophaga horti]UYQ93169.1 YafY family transcriptional regulator [Chitinophaga horti]